MRIQPGTRNRSVGTSGSRPTDGTSSQPCSSLASQSRRWRMPATAAGSRTRSSTWCSAPTASGGRSRPARSRSAAAGRPMRRRGWSMLSAFPAPSSTSRGSRPKRPRRSLPQPSAAVGGRWTSSSRSRASGGRRWRGSLRRRSTTSGSRRPRASTAPTFPRLRPSRSFSVRSPSCFPWPIRYCSASTAAGSTTS